MLKLLQKEPFSRRAVTCYTCGNLNVLIIFFFVLFGLDNIYSDKVHDIHKYNVKIIGSDSKPVAYLDNLLDML